MTCWNLLRWSFLMLCVRVQTWAKGCGDARWQLMHCYTDSARPPTTASSTLDGKPIEMTDILPAIQRVIARRILKGLGPHTETLFPQNIPKDHVFVSKPKGIVMTKNAHLITHVANVLVKNMGRIPVRTTSRI